MPKPPIREKDHSSRTQTVRVIEVDLATGRFADERDGIVRLCGRRVLLIVRPSSIQAQQVDVGVTVRDAVLQGKVAELSPAVVEQGELKVGDEVWFRRPEGPIPTLALMDVDLLIAIIKVPSYG